MSIHERAWAMLKEHTAGDPLRSAILSRALGVGDENTGTPATRTIITDLVRQGYPIGANSGGYFVIQTEAELLEYCADLRRREAGIRARIENVTSAFYYGRAVQYLPSGSPLHWIPEPEERS